jgi:hypothetical protein
MLSTTRPELQWHLHSVYSILPFYRKYWVVNGVSGKRLKGHTPLHNAPIGLTPLLWKSICHHSNFLYFWIFWY